jgi:NADPH2:quinone reductase
MMKAILCKAWGQPENLVIEEVESPVIHSGQVKVAIHACGINFGDTLMIAGKYQVKPPFPFTPGFEIAGEIIEIGSGVTQFKPGDRIIAFADYGGYAEEVAVPAAFCIPIPDNMDFVAAAAFLVAYGTSHLALDHRAHLQAGEVLLVHGAAGGVGLTAVEIGKQMGATVIATASTPQKLAVAQQYGADHLINYRQEDFRQRVKEITNGKGANVIYDPVGGDVFDQSLRCINWEGRLLVIGFASGRIPQVPANLTLVKNCSIVGVYWGAYAQRQPHTLLKSLQTLLSWYSQDKLKPHVSATYPLERVADAMNALINRQSTGKVVLTMR